jgi:hypothetical protein
MSIEAALIAILAGKLRLLFSKIMVASLRA